MPAKKGDAKFMPSEYSEGQLPGFEQSYKRLFELCNQIKGQKDRTPLEVYSKEFTSAADQVSQEIEKFKAKISSIPFIAAILVWASFVEKDKVFGYRYLDMMRELLIMDIIPYKNEENKPLTIEEFNALNYATIIDVIRCNIKWPEQKREDFVSFYVVFLNWLSDATFGYISKMQDPDRQLTARRLLPYQTYIEIISSLSLRDKILVKIFYLGGNRSLDEVFSLKIEDINFSECKLNLSGCFVSYPKHVLEDLKSYLGRRRKGHVFIGRDGQRIDHTVPYRAVKSVTAKLNLDPKFTLKDFVRDL